MFFANIILRNTFLAYTLYLFRETYTSGTCQHQFRTRQHIQLLWKKKLKSLTSLPENMWNFKPCKNWKKKSIAAQGTFNINVAHILKHLN